MNLDDSILKYSFLTCSGYFVCMSIAHFFGIKVPVLFIYYDVPFYEYQDKIISFAVVAYILLFFGAYQNRAMAPHAIIAGFMTVLGLSSINASEALMSVLEGGSTTAYWVQTAALGLLVIWLAVFYIRSKKPVES